MIKMIYFNKKFPYYKKNLRVKFLLFYNYYVKNNNYTLNNFQIFDAVNNFF